MKASEMADLVVLGRRGQRRLGSLLLGGTADRMIRICRRPVLVTCSAFAPSAYRRVLLPIDFSDTCDAAFRLADQLAAGASLTVFHAIDGRRQSRLRRAGVAEPQISEARAREDAVIMARMRHQAARWALDALQTSFAMKREPAVQASLHQARLLQADLIVVGKNGHSTLAHFLLGSVSSQVLLGADCDVLVVPRPRDEVVNGSPIKQRHAGALSALLNH